MKTKGVGMHMKKLWIIVVGVLVGVICVCMLPTNTQALRLDFFQYGVTDGKVTILSCDTSVSGEVTIPEEIDGYPVTEVGYRAFADCQSVTAICFPDSVTKLGQDAFANCYSLERVRLPEGITGIGYHTFDNCPMLTSITIPDSVVGISDEAFYGCTGLTGIWVGENNSAYSSDENGVLFNKDKTTLMLVPGQLSGSYTVPDSVTYIGKYAFAGSRLENITISDSVASIGGGAFRSCRFQDITIPDSVTELGAEAFDNCYNLNSIVLPKNLRTISYSLFYGCSSLKCIDIPASVTLIDSYAFGNCVNLKDVYYGGTSEQWAAIKINSNEYLKKAALHCNDPKPEVYLNVDRAIIRLQDQIKMGFYYEMETEQTVLETGAVVWTAEEYAKETAFDIGHTVGTKYIGKAENEMGTYYSIETKGIPSQDIGVQLYILPYALTEYGYAYADTIKSNSVLNVAKNQYTKDETGQEVKDIIADVLNYATAARNYFVAKGEMEAPAEGFNAILGDKDKELAWTDELLSNRANDSVLETGSEYAPAAYKVYVNIQEYLKVQFVFADASVTGALYWKGTDYTENAIHDTTTKTGEAGIAVQNGYVSCVIDGINAYNIYDNYYLRGYNEKGELTKTYTHSIAAYLTNQINNNKNKNDAESQALVELCKAMLIYGKNAKESNAVNKG